MRVAYPPYQRHPLRVDIVWISATHPPQSSKMLLTKAENAVTPELEAIIKEKKFQFKYKESDFFL